MMPQFDRSMPFNHQYDDPQDRPSTAAFANNDLLSPVTATATATTAVQNRPATAVDSTPRHRYTSSLNAINNLWRSANTSSSSFTQPPPSIGSSNFPGGPRNSSYRTHRAAKSIGSATTISSQPVIVRTYSGSRASSRNRGPPTPTLMPPHPSARLPPIEDFTFSQVLQSVEPEINGALDAIAEICARSRMSLADEHGAHIPPQGEIGYEGSNTWRARPGAREHTHTLTAVPEASSSSERLAGGDKDSRASSNQSKTQAKISALGSLRGLMAGSKRPSISSEPNGFSSHTHAQSSLDNTGHNQGHRRHFSAWEVRDRTEHPAIALVSPTTASNDVSLDKAIAVPATEPSNSQRRASSANRPYNHRGHNRSASLADWLPWSFASQPEPSSAPPKPPRSAEGNLRCLLHSTSMSQLKSSP